LISARLGRRLIAVPFGMRQESAIASKVLRYVLAEITITKHQIANKFRILNSNNQNFPVFEI